MGRISKCADYHEEILRMRSLKISNLDIANRLGLSRHSVQAYLQRRKLYSLLTVSERTREIDWDQIRYLIEVEGLTQEKAGEILGCDRTAIQRVCYKMGLKTARTGPRAGKDHQEWKGGRRQEKHGYIQVYVPLHPTARKSGIVFEHRLVMEVVLGRYLGKTEVVDHLDNHPWHNWPSNLRVFASNADHLKATLSGRKKSSPRKSISGAYGNNRRILHCPLPPETLAQCSEKIRRLIELHIQLHRPTNEQRHLSKSKLRELGPIQRPFQSRSRA